jgi:hypothetical protein
MPAFLLPHFELTVLHLGRKFEQWLIGTLNTTVRVKAAYAIQNSTLQPTELLQISYVLSSNSQVPVFPPSHFELTVPHFGRKFQRWLVDTPDTTLRLRAAYATQNSTPQPTKLLQISQLPAFLLSHFKLTVVHFGRKFEWWLINTLSAFPLRTDWTAFW